MIHFLFAASGLEADLFKLLRGSLKVIPCTLSSGATLYLEKKSMFCIINRAAF